MARPTAKFFEAQTPPDLPLMSIDMIDWYKESKRRCFEGFSFRGERMTGDQYWFYNFNPISISILDKFGNATKDFNTNYPYWSQEDDYLFKQIEEANQSDLGVMLMTGRGFGKTYLILSIGNKYFFLTKESHGLISASGKDHAAETWKKFKSGVNATNSKHPFLSLEIIEDNDNDFKSGTDTTINGNRVKEIRSHMELIVYDKKPGKTKGRRLNFQQFEECGDWGGAATLKECIAASEGSWKVGSIKKCREFYTGTGGTILSDQAKEIFFNPDAYGLYKVRQYADRPTAIFIPAIKKFGGFWEKDGISDEVGALAEIEKIRAFKLTDPDPTIYSKYIQEYPLTLSEMFMKKGGNRFDQKILAKNITIMEMDPSKRVGEWGTPHWKMKDGEIVGVDWEQSNNGKTWLLEKPYVDSDRGVVPPRLYVGGYDGIDVGTQDTASGEGSQGALSIKKRLLPGAGTNNIYVCHYFERPRVIEDFFENALMLMVMHNAITNIEDSKRGIVAHAKKLKLLNMLMKRPRLTLQNIETENESTLIGTTPTPKNFQYGETFLTQFIKHYGESILCFPVLEYLRDFNMEERGKYDVPISMMMCEIADDEYMDKPVGFRKQNFDSGKEFGYYTDSLGRKQWGEIPKGNIKQFNFKNDQQQADYIQNGRGIFLNNN